MDMQVGADFLPLIDTKQPVAKGRLYGTDDA